LLRNFLKLLILVPIGMMVQQSRPFSFLLVGLGLLMTFGLCSAVGVRGPKSVQDVTPVWKPMVEEADIIPGLRNLRGVNAATAVAATTATKRCYSICSTCVCAKTESLNCCAKESSAGYAGCVKGSEMQLCPTHRATNTCCR